MLSSSRNRSGRKVTRGSLEWFVDLASRHSAYCVSALFRTATPLDSRVHKVLGSASRFVDPLARTSALQSPQRGCCARNGKAVVLLIVVYDSWYDYSGGAGSVEGLLSKGTALVLAKTVVEVWDVARNGHLLKL